MPFDQMKLLNMNNMTNKLMETKLLVNLKYGFSSSNSSTV